MSLLEKTIEFVDKSFGEKMIHFVRTLYWMKFLDPKANEALLIAAYCHDIDRSTWLTSKDFLPIAKKLFLHQPEAIRKHEEHSARMMERFLIGTGADKSLVEKVKHLISRHEEGGDPEQNLLKDADSLSYFENNVNKHIERLGEFTENEIRSKTDYMFNRITLPKAKKIAKPLYKKAITKLEKAVKND